VSYRRHTVRFGIGLLWLTPVAVLTPFILDLDVPARHRLIYAAFEWGKWDALSAELAARPGSRSSGPDSARSAA